MGTNFMGFKTMYCGDNSSTARTSGCGPEDCGSIPHYHTQINICIYAILRIQMYYTVYKITCLLNGMIYVGQHKTKNLDDGYMGSGKRIHYALRKHGENNFMIERTLVSSEEETNELEELIVDTEFVSRKDTYNMTTGGTGGWSHVTVDPNRLREINKISQKTQKILHQDEEWLARKSKKISKKVREAYKRGAFNHRVYEGFKGNHTEETKKKIGAANSIKMKGENNSQYGTMWITNDITNKKIKKTDEIPDGWRRGRVMNKQIISV